MVEGLRENGVRYWQREEAMLDNESWSLANQRDQALDSTLEWELGKGS